MKVKNSNKILFLILGLVIVVPMLVAMVLRHKVRSGQFEMERNVHVEDPKLNLKGSLEGVKVIKLIGPSRSYFRADAFDISLLHNLQNSYTLKKGTKEDSMRIRHLGDTLEFFYYKSSLDESRSHHMYRHMDLTLHLAKNIPILAQNCTLKFTPEDNETLNKPGTAPTFVYLNNGAVLQMGDDNLTYALKSNKSSQKGRSVFEMDSSRINKDQFDSTFSPVTDFHVFASNSTIKFIQPLLFKDLELDMRDGSSLELSHPFKTGHLSGKIDADTEIKGDIRGLISIKALIKE